MLPVISEVATHKKHSKHFQISKKKSEAAKRYKTTATGSVLRKQLFLKVSQISQEKRSALEALLNKVTKLRPAALLKKDSSTGAFL